MSQLTDLQSLLDQEGIDSIPAAMRHKTLAQLGDSLTNLLFSFAHSLHSKGFVGEKVAGKTLAAALRLADLRHLAPSRLDAHGLGDCVEAMIAYGWIRGYFTISEAAETLQEHFIQFGLEPGLRKAERIARISRGFALFLQQIWDKEQVLHSMKSQ
ncbi:MAG: ribonuclease III family protein [Candidatus Hodarchaeota archaeon]